nr:immunoglobulin heavy chain junction region [Mus musculus]MBK4198573.1 immunoglobulin heavy chain junction region [Mus musculus]MBK4198574.1 immunoglobulin heavy chain junction region [Mus musculus]MBK4198575.1 immunoglobulin heavy chain junction region [Mus musculus]MBK4198576.1 immunoglobulin heavy chain junction region [Mus musculus]
CTRYFDYW